ncbi:MAG: MFS transporter [Alphaproteobacteria bacterium]|nr:MFS transporter [Alphaproteobacteria bacterium]MBV9062966.1 MFS transporter [Alphaproteobacteria bacterium]
MSQFLSVGAILLSTVIFLAGQGLTGTLLPVRAHLAQFSDFAIGLIGSAYFAGFIAGCYVGPRLLARVGHSRTFAAAAGIATAMVLMMSLAVNEFAWIVLRGFFGFAAANVYMVIESWLNDRATNQTRGRIFAAYLLVNFTGLIVGQWSFVAGRPVSSTLFILSAIFYALCLIPLGLTRIPQPHAKEVPGLRPARMFAISPVGVAGCIAVGFANAACWTFLPVYAHGQHLTRGLLSGFMSAFTLGGALIQLPVGRLSDRMDRRLIIAAASFIAAMLGIALWYFSGVSRTLTLALVALFGMAVLPVYGLSIAHANDRLPREMFVEASATLLLINAAASVAGPVIAATVTDHFGMPALFLYTAAVHLSLAAFVLTRIRNFASPPHGERYAPMPAQASPAALELDPRGEHEEQPQTI